MTGSDPKPRLNTVFKNVFPFKQKQQTYPSADRTPAKTAIASDFADDETSTCSSVVDTEGVLIFPLAQRLTASSAPTAIIDRMPGANLKQGDNKQHRGDSLLSFGRRRRISSSPRIPARSPYQSKKTRKSLPASLKANENGGDSGKP